MHNLRNHASLPHRETSRKAVWRHNQLPEVSLVYFARSTSNVCCGYSETMLCVFPACFAKWFPHGCYEVWDHQMTLTMSRQLLTEECHRNDLMTCTAENSEKVYPLQGFTVLLSFYINMCFNLILVQVHVGEDRLWVSLIPVNWFLMSFLQIWTQNSQNLVIVQN